MNRIYFKEVTDGNGKIGFQIDEDSYIIYIPKYYLSNEELNDMKEDTKIKFKKLFKAWAKYQKNIKTSLGKNIENTDGGYNLTISFDILQDYIENGLYIEQEKVLKKTNVGKMDFKNTLKKCKPLYTEQGPIFLEYISKSKKENMESFLKNIQCLILNDISTNIGWILGIEFNFNLNDNMKLDLNVIKKLKEMQIQTFNSRKLNLINMFLKYLQSNGTNIRKGKEVFVGVASLFWQDVINEVLGNVNKKELNKYFYIRHAFVSDAEIEHKLSPLMPDTVFKNNKNLIVIDAKYYLNGNLPNNDDINKQFLYMLKAYKIYPNKENYQNCFILPTDEETYIDKSQIKFDIDIDNEEITPIKVIFANFEEMINYYILDKKNTNALQDLILN